MRRSNLFLLSAFTALGVQAQNIGINTSGAAAVPSAMLDVDATTKGLLIPRVALTATNAAGPITAPANSLLVYNTATAGTAPNNVTPGYYYYETAGTRWVPILSGVKGWSTTGNAGTVAGTNFLGTTDANDFVVKTGGAAAANERLRVKAAGPTVVNNTTTFSSDVFAVYGTGSTNGTTGAISALGTSAINGYAAGDGNGLYAETSSATTSQGIAVIGVLNAANSAANQVNIAILGSNTSSPLGTSATARSARGVEGDVTGAPGNGATMGVIGFATSTTGDANGVWGQSASSIGTGVAGIATTSTSGAGIQPMGIYGQATSATGFGALVLNAAASDNGTGEFAIGQNATGTYLVTGSGGVYCGKTVGGMGFAENTNTGVGLLGVGNSAGAILPSNGAGIVGSGGHYGVMGYTNSQPAFNNTNNSESNGTNAAAGGYFELRNGTTPQTWTYVAARQASGSGGLRKIIGPGTVNTIVKDLKGDLVALSCPEAPENLFQDYGQGELVQGKAKIELDPILAKNIVVDDKHPLRVFIQVEGECNGVFVTKKSGTGFEVQELAGGSSNIAFTYTVIANRADEILNDGTVSRYSAERFAPAPGPVKSSLLETAKLQVNPRVPALPAADPVRQKHPKGNNRP